MIEFENTSKLGYGIYTVPDISRILNLKYYKVQRLLNEYWDDRIASKFGQKYSWSDGKSKAVSFHTLVEFYTFFHLKESGINTSRILNAHQELSKMYDTVFPFANERILMGIGIVGKTLVFQLNDENIINLDLSKQLNLLFVKEFIRKLDFGEKDLANRLWPLGKNKHIVIDPNHQFGQPTIKGTNLLPSTIVNLINAGEPKRFISATYGISVKQILDSIEYCKKVA
jgi:uncharacterized protein (DUF433 family)